MLDKQIVPGGPERLAHQLLAAHKAIKPARSFLRQACQQRDFTA